IAMGLYYRKRSRSFVNFARFNADDSIFDMIHDADAKRTDLLVQVFNDLDQSHAPAVSSYGQSRIKLKLNVAGFVIIEFDMFERVFRRLDTSVFNATSFNRPAP